MEHEIRPIPGFEGYFVSSEGDIFTSWVAGRVSKTNPQKRKRMSPAKGRNGYLFLSLRVSNRTYYQTSVHRLTCLAFHGSPNQGETASHLNGKRDDNRAENLAWESLSQNHRRKAEHGTGDDGVKNSRALIKNPEEIRGIRELLALGKKTQEEIGELFGVSRLFITKIKNGHRYKNY